MNLKVKSKWFIAIFAYIWQPFWMSS